MTDERRSAYVARFLNAENDGAITEWCYSDSPGSITLADMRYHFRDANGDMKILFHSEVGGYLDGLGY